MLSPQAREAETWLHPNRRVLFTLAALCLSVSGTGLLVAAQVESLLVRQVALGAAGVCAMALVWLLWQMFRPRLAFRDDRLLVFLRFGRPLAVPIELVECCFMGQAPSLLPGKGASKASAVVIRLAERAPEWSQRQVVRLWGRWCDGYITLRGTWTEALSIERVQQLNQRIASAQREHQQSAGAP